MPSWDTRAYIKMIGSILSVSKTHTTISKQVSELGTVGMSKVLIITYWCQTMEEDKILFIISHLGKNLYKTPK